MTRTRISLTTFLAPIALLGLAACGDVTPPVGPAPAKPQFAAQPAKGVWTVTSLDDPGTGTCTPGYCTLRQAIASAASGDKIVFKSALTGTIALSNGQLSIQESLTIDGGARITIDAIGATRLFVINSGVTASIAGLTLIRGHSETSGGAIVNSGSLTLNNVVVRDNEAPGSGGGVYNFGILTIVGSTIVGNHTEFSGGGVHNEVGGTVDIRNSTVTDNSSRRGAGIYNLGMMTLTGSTISGNTATGLPFSQGGGIFTAGPMAVRSSTITMNFADFTGGIHVEDGTLTLANSIVGGNLGFSAPDCNLGSTPGSDPNLVSLGHNITALCLGITNPTDIAVSDMQLFAEVLEHALKDNGGPTKTHALIERGRAVDAGYCPGETMDQRGFARPYDDSRLPNALDACDIGAFEWRPPATKPGK